MRGERNWTQDFLARRARELVGLKWSRVVVSQVESGDREVTAGELLALLPVFGISLDQLLASTETDLVAISPERAVPANAVSRFLTGDISGIGGKVSLSASMSISKKLVPALLGLPESVQPDEIPHLQQDARGETERTASRRLGISPLLVAYLSDHLWGRSLTEEREARYATGDRDTEDSNTNRTLRGHLTRQLLHEIRQSPLFSELQENQE